VRVAGARKLAAVVAMLVALGLAAGAALGAHAGNARQYRLEMKAPGRDVSDSLAAISDVQAKSLRYPLPATAALDAAAALAEVQGKLRRATPRLRAIEPPASVAKQHALLLTGALLLRAELTPIIAKLHKGQYAVVATLASLPGVVDLNSGLNGLRQRGFALGSN
jgi:hypothetical protein